MKCLLKLKCKLFGQCPMSTQNESPKSPHSKSEFLKLTYLFQTNDLGTLSTQCLALIRLTKSFIYKA